MLAAPEVAPPDLLLDDGARLLCAIPRVREGHLLQVDIDADLLPGAPVHLMTWRVGDAPLFELDARVLGNSGHRVALRLLRPHALDLDVLDALCKEGSG
ncbi:MAG: hypothetical protein ABIJ09_24825 [Pseudomonadota bacterium]